MDDPANLEHLETAQSRAKVDFRLSLSRAAVCLHSCSAGFFVCRLHPQDVVPHGHELFACFSIGILLPI